MNVDDLRDGPRGPLTSDGVAIIASMFDTTTPQTALADDTTQMPQDMSHTTQDTSQGPGAASAAVLQAKLDSMMMLVDQLTGERDQLREQVAALTAALEREQIDRQHERQLLTAGDEVQNAQPRRRWWGWWRHD